MSRSRLLYLLISFLSVIIFPGCPGFNTQNPVSSTTGSAAGATYYAFYGNVHYLNGVGADMALVKVASQSSSKVYYGFTDTWGNYRIPGLEPGTYIVSVDKADYFYSNTQTLAIVNSDVTCNFVMGDKIIWTKRYKSKPGVIAVQFDFASTKIGNWSFDHIIELRAYSSSSTATDNLPVNTEIYQVPWFATFPSDSAFSSADFASYVKKNYTYLGYIVVTGKTPAFYSSIVGSSVIQQVLTAANGVVFLNPDPNGKSAITTGPDGPATGVYVPGAAPVYDYMLMSN